MTDENNDEKVSGLEKKIIELEAQLSDVRGEAARSRVARNSERKKVFALNEVIQKHNVNFSVDEQDLSGLEIDKNTGEVTGDFGYELPKISPEIPRASGKGENLTLNDISNMTPGEINSRWDEIEALGKSGALN